MKSSSLLFSTAVIGVALSIAAFAQAPPAGGPPHEHEHGPVPAPTNLKVLPKTLTGEQVHEIMHHWAGQLGTECTTCHAADPTKKGPNGRPVLNFADDSKPEKAAARVMYTMVETINTKYVSKIDNSGQPVSCGTCHRGHLDPPPFTPAADHDHHEHAAPPTETKPPAQ
ncbi:MAG: c-type cytochrome [Terracidiphilus sp.]